LSMATSNLTAYYLPRDQNYADWRVRAEPRSDAREVAIIKAGVPFYVSDREKDDARWLRVHQIGRRPAAGYVDNRKGLLMRVSEGLRKNAIIGVNYVLPKFLPYDVWNVRASRSKAAKIVGAVQAGRPFCVTEVVRDARGAEWLKTKQGWLDNSKKMIVPVVEGSQAAVLPRKSMALNVAQTRPKTEDPSFFSAEPPRPPMLRRFPSEGAKQAYDDIQELKQKRTELRALQARQKAFVNCADLKKRSRMSNVFRSLRGPERMAILSQDIERLTQQLEMRGANPNNLKETMEIIRSPVLSPSTARVSNVNDNDDDDDDISLLKPPSLTRIHTVKHSDFANPQVASCWLSTTFQMLWHCKIFHHAFEKWIAPLREYPANTTTGALQRTWNDYHAYDPDSDAAKVTDVHVTPKKATSAHESKAALTPAQRAARRSAKRSGKRLSLVGITPKHLVHRWHKGYGDPLEVVRSLQTASPEDADALKRLGAMIAQCPIAWRGNVQSAPSHADIWRGVESMGVEKFPILFVKIEVPVAMRTPYHLHRIAQSFQPAPSDSDEADLGFSHRLRGMICYMFHYKHYVCFCARRSKRGQWMLFNDLPGLEGRRINKPVELKSWEAVAEQCGKWRFAPVLLLYESAELASKELGA